MSVSNVERRLWTGTLGWLWTLDFGHWTLNLKLETLNVFFS
jgi:hypothetical protein